MAAFCSHILRLDLHIFRVPTTITHAGRAYCSVHSCRKVLASKPVKPVEVCRTSRCLPGLQRGSAACGVKIVDWDGLCGAWMSHLRWCRRRAFLLRGSMQSRMSRLPHRYIKARVRWGEGKMCLGFFEHLLLRHDLCFQVAQQRGSEGAGEEFLDNPTCGLSWSSHLATAHLCPKSASRVCSLEHETAVSTTQPFNINWLCGGGKI